ncbi:MAG: Holliday junction resolvase RuvX [Bacilli bacterium]|nr:Holliday junction resolvase RuvX [Bacilli bacterium]
MTYLGLDLGTKTLGISKSSGVIASFYKTLRHNEDYDYLIRELSSIIEDEKVDKIVLGYPKNMNNTESDMARIVLDFKKKLEDAFHIEVILEDERLTSKISNDLLISGNVSRMKRKKVVDGVASVVILESFLDRRNNGK